MVPNVEAPLFLGSLDLRRGGRTTMTFEPIHIFLRFDRCKKRREEKKNKERKKETTKIGPFVCAVELPIFLRRLP